MGYEAGGRLPAELRVFIIFQWPGTQIFDHRVVFDAEPLLEHRKGPVLSPQEFIDIPPL